VTKSSEAAAPKDPNADVAQLSYEAARDELQRVVAELEQNTVSLEAAMALWQRGEALAQHCEQWLSGARARLDEALKQREDK
jgi:exodeoxyribonuclease VII small subunit